MRKAKMKVLSFILVACMMFTMLPVNVMATETVSNGNAITSVSTGDSLTMTNNVQPTVSDGDAGGVKNDESEVIAVSGITLDQATLEVGVGAEPVTLIATVLPEDATDKSVNWTSSEPGVASVEDGVVTFGYMGEAVITATAGEYSASCAVTVGEGEWSDYADDAVVVIAASDYQKSDSGTIMTNIMKQIKEDYGTPYGALLGGDYDAGSVTTTASHIEAVDAVIDSVFPGIAFENRIYIQGNHENYAGLKVDGTNLMNYTGAYDTDYYGVYAFNHDDFPWSTSSNPKSSETLVQQTADDLGDYLEAKVAEGYTKPVFIMSHLPLHDARDDNYYARQIFDELEAAGEAGLNVIFLCGHNHSGGYDAHLGNGSYYLPKGSSLTVVDGKSGTYTDDSISFTYMNYGYLGKISGSACTHQTMTVFEITDSQVTVKRYDEDSLHVLKAAGTSYTDEIGTEGAVIELGEPEEKVEKTDNNVTVAAPGLTGLTVTKVFGTNDEFVDFDSAVYSAYASYDITPTGYEQGKSATVTITLDAADGFDVSRKVFVIDVEKNTETETSIVDGKVTFKTDHFSTYNIAQKAFTASTGFTYELVSEIEAGGQYVIVGNDDLAVLMDNEGSMATQSDGLSLNGTTLTSEVELTLWTISGTSAGTIVSNQGNGLSYSDSSFNLTGEADNTFNIASGDDNNFTILTVRSNSRYSKYYFNYDGSGWTSKPTAAAYVRLYKLTSEGTGSGSTVTPEGGDWVTITDGAGKIIYELDTDGVNEGEKYLIVNTGSNGAADALTNNDGSTTSTDVTIDDGKIKVDDDTNIAWVFESSTTGTLTNGSHYIYLSYNNSGVIGTSNRDVTVTNNGNGAYAIKRDGYDWWIGYSNGWTRSSSTNNIYLFRMSGSEAAGDAEYAKIQETDGTTDFTFTVSRGTSAENALAEVMEGIDVLISSDKAEYTILDDTDENIITWELTSTYGDGTTAGEYAVKIYYKDKLLGIARVIVPEVTINGITVSPASGAVTVGASEAALVGATITVDVADGEGDDFTVPVTVGMLSGDGLTTATVGTYTGLTVSYNGFTYPGFTLTVKEKVVNNYPDYPNEGAVKVDKTATGIDFQKTGVAKVELTTSGVPMNQGVDVLLVLDTSSSMSFQGSLTDDSTRIAVLKDCVDALIRNLKADRADGSKSDIDIAIVDFAGYLLGHDGTKLNNYIGEQVKSTDSDDVGAVLTDGWVSIQTLDDNWGTQSGKITQKSGTNYDHGLEQAYELLAQKQADNGDNTRKQFVLFLSDGAPLQYNGVNSNSLKNDWERWILGSYTQEEVKAIETIQKPEFYYGNNNGNGQKHWIAEAIKGSPDNKYSIVYHENDTYGEATMGTKQVSGLGATIYTVGLALEATNMPTDEEGQAAILSVIASSPEVSKAVTSAAGLQDFFDDFAGAVLYAAENAVFEDQLGASYNIQMASSTVRTGSDGKVFELNSAPTMEVREYTIWTRAELEDENGNLSEANAKKVGTRKTDDSGNYIYKTLEIVSFNDNGTEAYTGGDTTNNIMVDNVICANTFWYNNGTTTVQVDVDGDGTAETDLAPETFIWKVGTIKSAELALSYYVYLDDSLEGEASAGSYATNNYAILSYDNYLGNPCKKDTVSPELAWLSANVSYAYYLVNSDGQPVNANGDVVTFANREVIVHPTLHDEIPLNSDENWVGNLAVASTGVLDNGNYSLFDYDAQYQITVNSDATGAWNITVGTKTNEDGTTVSLPATTYVTGFSDTEPFSNVTATSSNEESGYEHTPGYDYTHTTVWFAVVWEPDALDDTVVIDYGLPVDVHVLTNDFFGDFGSLVGVAKGTVTDSDSNIATNEILASENPVSGEFGTAQVILPEIGANKNNSVIRYTLESMEMTKPEVFTYSVEYTNTKLHNNNGFYYGKLTVIPATTIYYEDTFLNMESYNRTDSSAEWNEANLWNRGTSSTVTQDEDRPGDINFAFDTVIDANNVYGNDSAYETMSTHSLGNAASVHVDANSYATATFTFYGTGFDVVSMTSNTTGTLAVQVSSGSTFDATKLVRNTLVDTFYGMDEGGSYSKNDPAAIYQVPVIRIFGMEYGQYTVKITATYNINLDHTATQNEDGTKDGYDLYLDAIRIYDPTGNENEVANGAYAEDGEAYPIYEELRDNVINTDEFFAEATVTKFEEGVTYYTKDEEGNYVEAVGEFSDSATYYIVNTNSSIYEENGVKGALFIDCDDATTSIADYISYGPNNELYLANGQAIAFTVDVTGNMADVQLGIKVANGGSVTYEINGDSYTVNTTTDMYYSIWEYVKDSEPVTIKHVDGGILSLTNIKATFSAETITNGLLRMSAEDTGTVLMMLRRTPAVEEEVPEPTVPEETEPEVTEPAEPDSTELQAAVDAAKKLKRNDYTKESFKAVESARKAAEKVIRDENATQTEIDEALAALNEAIEALEAKSSNAKPGRDQKPGRKQKDNQNKSNNNSEEQEEDPIAWITNTLFGWMFD